ncbi:hypothetical protein ACQ5SB_20770 [Stenotrophomonas geniculata]|uniref:hypothetical protein n=1 Tax=Stenotrophomonas TaxID=40323 RepID=UPI003D34F0CF
MASNGWASLGEAFAGGGAGQERAYQAGQTRAAQLATLLAGAQIKRDEAMQREQAESAYAAAGLTPEQARAVATAQRAGFNPAQASGYSGDMQLQDIRDRALNATDWNDRNALLAVLEGKPVQLAGISDQNLINNRYVEGGGGISTTEQGRAGMLADAARARASDASAASSFASAARTRQAMGIDGAQFALQRAGQWNPGGKTAGGAGGAAGPGKLTEGQGKDIVYFSRGRDSNALLQKFGDNLLMTQGNQGARGILDSALRGLPFVGDSGLVNGLISSDRQQAQQAAAEFLSAILRKDTGAAITKQEFDIYGPMYLPMPGDSAATLEQKAVARQGALEGIKAGLGNAQAAIPAPRERSRLEMPSAAAAFGGSVPPAAPVQRARNPQTGEVRVLINGQWVPE